MGFTSVPLPLVPEFGGQVQGWGMTSGVENKHLSCSISGSPSSFAFQAHDLTFMPWKEHTCCLFPSLACSCSSPGDIFSGLMKKALPD